MLFGGRDAPDGFTGGLSVTTLSSEAGRSSSYLVRASGVSLVVDAGPGTMRALEEYGGLATVDGMIVTHGHADHCLDLAAVGYARRFPEAAAERLPLWLPAGAVPVLESLDGIFGVPTLETMRRPIQDSFEVFPMEGEKAVSLGIAPGVVLTVSPARHAVPAITVRLETAAGSVVFSGDTGYGHDLVAAAEGADLFFCEATYLRASRAELEGHGHLTAALAGVAARNAAVEHLVLSHLSRPADGPRAAADAAQAFGHLPISVTSRGDRVTLPPPRGR